MDDSSVRVVVRIRPQTAREAIDGCNLCTTVTPDQPQIWMGGNHGFTFDQVHDIDSSQDQVFSTVESLVDGCLEGYNATILAYGQTGSGKTYTMGTGFDAEHITTQEITSSHGIIPRAVHHLFDQINTIRKTAVERNEVPPDFTVKAQFVELHNEELNDLLSPDFKAKQTIKIHEHIGGGIYLIGVESKEVTSVEDTMRNLREGALIRSTASTNMNDSSSRSHAIFTLHVSRLKYVKTDEGDVGETSCGTGTEIEKLSAKFHFVDLAGSERLKRTGAVGERAKEGISINSGLLSLGNVISALGDKSKKALHVPYRDSKLTRLLQDSLGGNSRTIMIACISPCDRDFVETLNSLKYANRARNIKNKVTINQDKSSRIISNLRQEILRLEAELEGYKQGKVIVANGEETQTDLYHENLMLSNELEKFRTRVKALQETVDRLTASNAELIADRECGSLVTSAGGSDYTELVRKYVSDIEELRSKLYQSEATCSQLRKKQNTTAALLNQSLSPRPTVLMTSRPGTAYSDLDGSTLQSESVSNLITAAHSEIRNRELHRKKLRKKLNKRRLRRSGSGGITINGSLAPQNGNDSDEESSESTDEEEEGSEEDLEDEEVGSIEQELVNIDDQIHTTQRLIAQLELSNKRAVDTKEQYEQQIQILVTKIKRTEEERDSVLTSLKPTSATSAKVKQVKEEFEAKLASQTKDLNRMKDALKEHNQLIKKNAATEKQVETLKSEVDGMKRLKVKLQIQLKEENVKFRENDAKRQKEILQLKKEHRKKEVEIRTLQSKDKLKDQILKRKYEEVSALKKQNKNALSRRAGGRLPPVPIHKRLSPAKAKKKWAELQSVFEKRASDRRLMEQMELEMLTHIQSRKKSLEEIEQLEMQIASGNLSEEEINRFNDDIDSLKASLQYSDERISMNQRDICELTSGSPKTEEQIPDISLAMDHFSKEDCEYLMQKMYDFTMENVGEYKEAATKLSIAEEQVNNLTLELVTANELLSHVFAKYCADDPNLSPDLSLKINNVRAANKYRTVSAAMKRNGQIPPLILPRAPEPEPVGTNGQSLRVTDAGTKDGPAQNGNPFSPESPTSIRRFVRRQIPVGDDTQMSRKARRLTSSRKELMGDLALVTAPALLDDGFVRPGPVESRSGPLFRTSSLRLPRSQNRLERRDTFVIPEKSPTTDSLNNITAPLAKPLSAGRKPNLSSKTYRAPSSAPSNGVTGSNSEFYRLPTDNFNADTTFIVETTSPGTVSAPGSPGTARKVVNDNVFQRLSTTSGTNIEQNVQQGSIRSIRERTSQKSPFQLTHVAYGHSKAVLDLCVTEDRLFTSGKDSAVKVWDLNEMREINSINMPAIVSRVKFVESSHLLFCASGCFVRIYDVRKNQCINTLSSAGICNTSDPSPESYAQFPPREQQIAAIAVAPDCNSLYTSYGQMVRLWDMRSFTSLGIITGKHQSNVMCMESRSGENGSNSSILVTGSKDHCIKVYAYNSTEPFMNISVAPKATLSPPHYDGIECFALSGSTLFSGSRDCCIKKWDLSVKGEHSMAYSGAHSGWITGLCLPASHPQYLVSASRDATMKVWHKDSSHNVGQVEAHKGGVNCLTSNKTTIFTGSNDDGNVGFWKLRNLTDSSGESTPLTGSPEAST